MSETTEKRGRIIIIRDCAGIIRIEMWGGRRFREKRYLADCRFYPHGHPVRIHGNAACYAGTIYAGAGNGQLKAVGDYAADNSVTVGRMFIISFDL